MQFCLGWHAFPLLLYSFVFSFFSALASAWKYGLRTIRRDLREQRSACIPTIKLSIVPYSVYSLCWYGHLLNNNKEFTVYKPCTFCDDLYNEMRCLYAIRVLHARTYTVLGYAVSFQTRARVAFWYYTHGWRNNNSQPIEDLHVTSQYCAFYHIGRLREG